MNGSNSYAPSGNPCALVKGTLVASRSEPSAGTVKPALHTRRQPPKLLRGFALVWMLGLGLWCFAASASEPKPLMTEPGKLLLSEGFSAASLPKNWQPGGRPNSFKIVDGALQGVCAPDDSHGPAVGVPLTGRNLTIAFSMKHLKPGNLLFLVDGDSQFGGQAHLLRVGLPTTGVAIQQDSGSADSKLAQKKERDQAVKEGRKAPQPTKEQLADPKFYRTERLGFERADFADAQWHHVLIEQYGNEVLVQVDDKITLPSTGTVIDAPKSRIVFLVGGAGTALIDNVKVWENALRPDWSATKAKLARKK